MANERRDQFNFVSGTLSSSLTNVATSMSSAGLANLGVIDATNYAAVAVENEIVWVTAHTGGATTATILRAQEGTSAVSHSSGVAWQHGPTALDVSRLWKPPACRVYHNANQSIAAATETTLAFNTERFDTDSMHDTVTNNGRITFTTAGLYVVTATVQWAAGTGTWTSFVSIRMDGATSIAFDKRVGASGMDLAHAVSTLYKFTAGQYVELRVWQNSGTLNLLASGNNTPEFGAAWIGTGL